MLMTYLADPEPNMWRMYALIHGLGHLDCICMDANVDSILSGLWKDSPWCDVQLELIKLISHITKDDYSENHFHNMSVICRLFDDEDLVEKAEFKPAWNGFLRMYNVYQFIPGAVFITSRGIAEGQYLWLMTEAKEEKARVTVDAEALAVLQSMTDAYIHPFLSFIADNGLPLPEAGYELCDENGQVIASAELGWPDQKIAFLREDEKEFVEIFTARGWRSGLLDTVIADPSVCISMFK